MSGVAARLCHSLGHHLCLKISCLVSVPLVKVENVLVSEEMASHAEQGGSREGAGRASSQRGGRGS